MSYCVNCGVKLSKSEHKCPLCGTIVVNPNIDINNIEEAYPDRIEIHNPKINWKYLFNLFNMFLIVFGLTTVLCDLFIIGKITWSLYVLASTAYVGIVLFFMFLKNKYISLIIWLLSTELFIFLIAYLNNGMSWFLYLVMPFLFIFGIFCLIILWIIKRKNKNLIRILSFVLFFCALSIIVIEILIDLYNFKTIDLYWSIFVTLPILLISIVFIVISCNKKMLEEIKQRIFI
ncbi:MAG: hypothetical protein GX032_00850 [Tenericutes bacterium]|nr:DUF6320 domain-containing protein [Bacilli bacterium]MDD3995244.1 DUF6320 domain-containing protein [Bacilli bacterium]MDD4624215.1 DUF6320 domain-containing protein [Bacilli bacterium]NLV90009.1 hypothetical protein [Mycoplasmatota bacterium]